MEAVSDGPIVRFRSRRLQDVNLPRGQALQTVFDMNLFLLIFGTGGDERTGLFYGREEHVIAKGLIDKIISTHFDDLNDGANVSCRR